jgi:hypothetical protein
VWGSVGREGGLCANFGVFAKHVTRHKFFSFACGNLKNSLWHNFTSDHTDQNILLEEFI